MTRCQKILMLWSLVGVERTTPLDFTVMRYHNPGLNNFFFFWLRPHFGTPSYLPFFCLWSTLPLFPSRSRCDPTGLRSSPLLPLPPTIDLNVVERNFLASVSFFCVNP